MNKDSKWIEVNKIISYYKEKDNLCIIFRTSWFKGKIKGLWYNYVTHLFITIKILIKDIINKFK